MSGCNKDHEKQDPYTSREVMSQQLDLSQLISNLGIIEFR